MSLVPDQSAVEQWHRYIASPPATSRTSASRTQGTHHSSPMLGNAVNSRTPSDFHPRSHMGSGVWPVMKRQAETGPHRGGRTAP